MEVIKELNDDDLKEIGITKLGHRKKLLKHIRLQHGKFID